MEKTGLISGIGRFFFGVSSKENLKIDQPKLVSPENSVFLKNRSLEFEHYCQDNNLESLDYLNESSRSFLALTQSGSIICVGPEKIKKGKRDILYIGTSKKGNLTTARFKHSGSLKSKIIIGKRLVFDKGPIQKSSPLIKIASSPIYSLLNSSTIFGSK